MEQKTAIIIGAGPAGLTAAYELLERTSVLPVICEMSADIGGISKTINYKGNRIDLGGHRFFSKSDRVMQWWLNILPLQGAPDPEKTDRVMLVRRRLSRIFFMRKFFDYPVTLNVKTLSNLGIGRLAAIGFSYIKSRLFPIREEKSLEDFFINRFGKELYRTFFRDYTQKVWGVPCRSIKPDWGSQRVKGLSITKALLHAARNLFSKPSSLAQKNVETSLIEQFMYPKHGPGQLWENAAGAIRDRGGIIHLKHKVVGIEHRDHHVTGVWVRDEESGTSKRLSGDYFFSSMPVQDLLRAFGEGVPTEVLNVSEGLSYRDFITVGLLLKELKIKNETEIRTINNLIPDNWIYVQERDVRMGRIQVFNNWSPYMVKDKNTVWLGLEYFCNEGDDLWSKTDEELASLAVDELLKMGVIDKEYVLDHIAIRMQKTYPGYFGTYDRFPVIRDYVDRFDNLFLIGRNGMHRYNNQDHSMLTAMMAVDNVANNRTTKENIWDVNAEEDYHEEK